MHLRSLLVAALLLVTPAAVRAQSDAPLTPPAAAWTGPRTSDGQPDVHGSYGKNWIGSRGPNFDLEDGQDPDEMRATGRKPEDFPRPQIVRTPDGKIPYQPWARALRAENRKNFFNATELRHLDSNARCLPMGFPRESLDQGAEIVQAPGFVFFEYPYNSVVRTIYLDGRPPLNDRVKLWYGDSRGRWDGPRDPAGRPRGAAVRARRCPQASWPRGASKAFASQSPAHGRGHGLTVKANSVSPAATRTYCRPSTM
jgi:hypothetical protein